MTERSDRRGVLSIVLAFTMWGLFPLYFRALRSVPPLETLLDRVAWSALFLTLVVLARRSFAARALLRTPRVRALVVTAALLLAGNWFVYIWAINNGHVVDASLGYYINPLLNVALGALVFRERLRRLQWAAVLLASLGVVWLTLRFGELPAVGLALALSWGGYGLVRKLSPLSSLDGVLAETTTLAPLALLYLGYLAYRGQNHLLVGSGAVPLLLVFSGPLTAAPLLLFGTGVRRVPLSVVGVLQYIQPTLQLVLGVSVFGERFQTDKAVGYGCIWVALAMFSVEGVLSARRARVSAALAE